MKLKIQMMKIQDEDDKTVFSYDGEISLETAANILSIIERAKNNGLVLAEKPLGRTAPGIIRS